VTQIAPGSDEPASRWSGIWTVPNFLSFARICCVPWFLWLLFGADDRAGSALLLGALGATDWVDGWVARRFNQVSDIGKVLDPTADRLLLLVAAPAMIVDGSVPIWFASIVLLRELLVGGGALVLAALGATRMDVTWLGKTGTFALMFAFPCFLAGESTLPGSGGFEIAGWLFGLPGLVISWWAGVRYIPAALEALREGRS